jgi:glycine/D-amino acid oxidase-like deaminating enzyme
MADVLVIGGGVVGVSAALMCARRGLAVTLCERGTLAAGASGRNFGLVTGPHPAPLRELARRSLQVYAEVHHASGRAFWFDRVSVGSLAVAERAADLDGLEGELLDAAALREAEPLLAHDLAGARLLPCQRVDPGGAVAALADEARAHGAEILLGCPARGLLRSGAGAVRGALTDAGAIAAETTVVAAGHWSWALVRGLGLDLPIRGVRGWIALTRPAPFRLGHVIEDAGWSRGAEPFRIEHLASGAGPAADVHVGLAQDADGRVLLGASLQASRGDREEGEEILQRIAARALRVLPPLAGLEIQETRSCVRPLTPDGLPFHGPVPGADGLVLACGHNAQGVTWGPGAGAALADGIVDGTWEPALLPERAGVVA